MARAARLHAGPGAGLDGLRTRFLPRQTPGSFNPDEAMKMLTDAQGSG
jgi:hypothetical protein